MEMSAVKEKLPDEDAGSLDAANTVKTESADVDDVYSLEEETIVKEELEIGPTVIRPPDYQYKQRPYKQDQTAGSRLSDQSDVVHLMGPQPTVRLVRLSDTELLQYRSYESLLYNIGDNSDSARVTPSKSSTTKTSLKQVNLIAGSSKSQSLEADIKSLKQVRSQVKAHGGQHLSGSNQTTQQRDPRVSTCSVYGSFRCDVCGKSFSFKRSLTRHLLIHTGLKPFSCDVCDKSFSFKSCLSRHLLIHTGLKPFSCNVCGKCFGQKGYLKKHVLIHIGQNPYSCNVCGKSFKQKKQLNTHELLHTGQKPYSCNVCGKSFKLKGHLNMHASIHTGQKPYSCNVCGKSFKLISHLNMHAPIHRRQKSLRCNVCGKNFKQNWILTRHLLIHTGQKPYSCIVCGKCFTQKGYLYTHVLIHV